jgi:hypothetical protein
LVSHFGAQAKMKIVGTPVVSTAVGAVALYFCILVTVNVQLLSIDGTNPKFARPEVYEGFWAGLS